MYDFLHDFFFVCVSFNVILSLIFLSFVSCRSQHTNFCFPQFYSFTCFASSFFYCLSTCLIHSSVVLIFLHRFFFDSIYISFCLFVTSHEFQRLAAFLIFCLFFFCVSFSCLVLSCLLIQQKS